MRIITKCVLDMATGQVLLEEAYDYDGPVAHCDMGGPTSTQSTKPWHKYVPTETYEAYKGVLPELQEKSKMGLTPQEESYYRGKTLSDTAQTFAGAKTGLEEQLARMGTKGGAAAESVSDLARTSAMSKAKAMSDLTATDIQRKDVNIDRLLKAISLPGSPVVTSSTSGGGGS